MEKNLYFISIDVNKLLTKLANIIIFIWLLSWVGHYIDVYSLFSRDNNVKYCKEKEWNQHMVYETYNLGYCICSDGYGLEIQVKVSLRLRKFDSCILKYNL